MLPISHTSIVIVHVGYISNQYIVQFQWGGTHKSPLYKKNIGDQGMNSTGAARQRRGLEKRGGKVTYLLRSAAFLLLNTLL